MTMSVTVKGCGNADGMTSITGHPSVGGAAWIVSIVLGVPWRWFRPLGRRRRRVPGIGVIARDRVNYTRCEHGRWSELTLEFWLPRIRVSTRGAKNAAKLRRNHKLHRMPGGQNSIPILDERRGGCQWLESSLVAVC